MFPAVASTLSPLVVHHRDLNHAAQRFVVAHAVVAPDQRCAPLVDLSGETDAGVVDEPADRWGRREGLGHQGEVDLREGRGKGGIAGGASGSMAVARDLMAP